MISPNGTEEAGADHPHSDPGFTTHVEGWSGSARARAEHQKAEHHSGETETWQSEEKAPLPEDGAQQQGNCMPSKSAMSGHTCLVQDHELVCLTYEEALKRGLEAEYGRHPDGGYWIEIYGCSLNDLSEILTAAEFQRNVSDKDRSCGERPQP